MAAKSFSAEGSAERNAQEQERCAHPACARGVDDTVAHGRVTDEPHVLLLCTHFVLEFKHGEKGSH